MDDVEADVVRAAASVGKVGQVLDRDLGFFLQHGKQLFIRHMFGEAVAAEQENVVLAQDVGPGYLRFVVFRSQSAGQAAAFRMAARLLAGDDAAFHHFLHPGVVFGKLVEGFSARQVEPAVSCVGIPEIEALDQQQHNGAAHAPQFRIGLPCLQNLLMGEIDALAQDGGFLSSQKVAAKVGLDRFHSQSGSAVAARATADAVTKQQQGAPVSLAGGKRVFVAGADAALVGQAGNTEANGAVIHTNSLYKLLIGFLRLASKGENMREMSSF